MDKIEIIDLDDEDDSEEEMEEDIEEDEDEEYEKMCIACRDLMKTKTDRQLIEALVLKVTYLELNLKRMQNDLDEAYSVLIQSEEEEDEED